MRRFSFVAAAFVFAALSAASAFGQTPTTPASGTTKVVVIDGSAFGAKDGITKVFKAMESIDAEFLTVRKDLETMQTRLRTLKTEIDNAQKAGTPAPGVPAKPLDPQVIQAKVDEGTELQTKFERAKQDAEQKFQRRSSQVLGPVMQEVYKGLDDFGKAKGYALILDVAKLAEAGVILAYDATKVDVTKEFITYYNARPATTATTAAPPR
jgi:Skp family chaperone for outer membrane proteins